MQQQSNLKKTKMESNDLFNDLVSIKPKKPATNKLPTPMTAQVNKNNSHHDFDVGLLNNGNSNTDNTASVAKTPTVSADPPSNDDYLNLFHLQPQAQQISSDFSIFNNSSNSNNHVRSSTAPPNLSAHFDLLSDQPITHSKPVQATPPSADQAPSPKHIVQISKPIKSTSPLLPPELPLIDQLTQMGFDPIQSKQAIQIHPSLNEAVDYLVNGQKPNNQPSSSNLVFGLLSKASKIAKSTIASTTNTFSTSIASTGYFNPVDPNKDGLYNNKPTATKPNHHLVDDTARRKAKELEQIKLHWYTQIENNLLISICDAKQNGDDFVKQGQYASAITCYSGVVVVAKHPLMSLIKLEIAGCQLETGLYKECLSNCNDVIQMTCMDVNEQFPMLMIKSLVDTNIDGFQFNKKQLMQTLVLKAKGLEGLEKYEQLLEFVGKLKSCQVAEAEQELRILRDVHSRVNQHMNKINNTIPITTTIQVNQYVQDSKRVQEMRSEQALKEKQQQQELSIKDEVDLRIKQWSIGKEHNIRILLTTIGPLMKEIGIEWVDIPISGIMLPLQIKKAYMKSVSKLHPDKVKINNAVTECRCKTIFYGTTCV
eukprot:NODE_84_length_22349_cov_0.357888.p2 type:complete len:596 gc:universal NODE_84_length_22349_cov_0.357888:11925-13712(+)